MDNNYLGAEPQEKEMPQEREISQENEIAVGKLENLGRRVEQMIQDSKDPVFTQYLYQMRNRVLTQYNQVDLLNAELDKRYQMYQKNQEFRQQVQGTPQMQATPQMYPIQPQVIPQAIPQAQPPRQKSNMEFTIGAAVLSIVGSVFILIALALLGIHFMNGFVKGMALYVVWLLVIGCSEILVRKKWPVPGTTFSAVGIGGLYLTTMINYFVLNNFGMWIAVGLTLAITLATVFLSRKRNAVTYRILGMAAVYICILVLPMNLGTAEGGLSQMEFLVVTGMLFLINLMCLAVPIKRGHEAVNIVHLILNTVFTVTACFMWEKDWRWSSFSEMWHYPVFLAVSLLLMQLIFVAQIRWKVKQKPESTMADNAGICIAYGISAFAYEMTVAFIMNFPHVIASQSALLDAYMVQRLVSAGVALLICMLPLVFIRKRQEKWFAWYLLNLLLFAIYVNVAGKWEVIGCLVVLLVASKILSFTKNQMLCISDAIITALVCVLLIAGYGEGMPYEIPMFAAVVLSVFCINYWKTYFNIILTATIGLYVSSYMLPMLQLPVLVGILFVGMMVFNNVKRWRDSGIFVYNGLMLAGQIVCFLLLAKPEYQNQYITYLSMLIFGVSTIVICLQENYQMDFGFKQMILVVFLTYMSLIIRTGYPVVNSILMMVVALVAVGMGFAVHKKSVRIYGLVLSLLVCGKIVWYDFIETPILQKTILFFITGIIALVISVIYMVLEKKQSEGKVRADVASVNLEQDAPQEYPIQENVQDNPIQNDGYQEGQETI